MSKELVISVSTIGELQFALGRAANAAGKGLEKGSIEIALRAANDKRSLSQNAKLWPMLADIARQVQWPVNGRADYLPPEDWKDILTAGLDSEQRVAQGINGGFVMLGRRTSRMRKAEFAQLIELIEAFGAQHEVRWSDPSLKAFDEYKEAQ